MGAFPELNFWQPKRESHLSAPQPTYSLNDLPFEFKSVGAGFGIILLVFRCTEDLINIKLNQLI
ncbi:unnamed protein product [Eruca vesicaria subsp. sativa]|uniref:Uncharacterized protein n=1 Tax=Eruca vesicaria subsp. sativa TaxID=29727 RepID=A0ABC8KD70_ERUVS|nr:unnamed protein product [Eruca vesicaria subsp. sativa]